MAERVATGVGAGELRLGSYRIVRRIASGGMGTVYLAHRESWTRDFSKPVALKVMHPHLAREASFVRMFLDEARVAIQIEHPHVCNVIEVGVANGSHFIVMEYLNGKTLGQIIKDVQKNGPSKDAPGYYETYQNYVARIIADAADGLHAAHEAKSAEGVPLEIVHRDVSPHNIMVTYTGAVKVVDFGIAHAKERLEQTESGLVKGKLKYASPEQISGRGVDKRTDVWSLGVCLWEAVTLTHPFGQSDQAEVVAAITGHRMPSPSELAPWLHPELETILLRALSADPAARYATAREMSAALRAFLFSSRAMVEAAELGDWLQVREPASAAGAPAAPDEAEAMHEALSGGSTGVLQPSDVVTNNERAPEVQPVPVPPPHGRRHPLAWALASAAALSIVFVSLAVTRSDAHTAAVTPASAPQPEPAPEPVKVVVAAPLDLAPRVEPPAADAQLDALEVDPAKGDAPPPRPAVKEAPVVRRPLTPPSAVLNVVAVGGSVEVWVDGALRGTSPLKLDVPAGRHQVKLIEPGSGESSDQQITFIGGVERTMRVELGGN